VKAKLLRTGAFRAAFASVCWMAFIRTTNMDGSGSVRACGA